MQCQKCALCILEDLGALILCGAWAGELPEGSLVLGASASGATVYAEPAPAVVLNNAEAHLSGAEAAEEAAILRRLTRAVLQHSARLRQVCHVLGLLEAVSASRVQICRWRSTLIQESVKWTKQCISSSWHTKSGYKCRQVDFGADFAQS